MIPGIIPFVIHSLILLQALHQAKALHRKLIPTNEHQDTHLRLPENGDRRDSGRPLDPELNVFFHYNTLKPGTRIAVYYQTNNPSTTPRLLPREEADSIPFTSTKLPDLLRLFGFPAGSKQAVAMKSTLHHCEHPALRGETKFCATSLESMLDSVQAIFGKNSRFRVLTTNRLSGPLPPLQNYTVSEQPNEIRAAKMLGCHKLPYPYAVFYCHGQAGDRKLYRVLLDGDSGGRVDAVAICHMDTSQWDPDHVAFEVMRSSPGESPVCHFFPPDNLVWIAGP
ncbi:BURP domain protein USPL1-like [Andrographis paniculata]|uniref:BURP domain protein USPL1-like n=1 Tax=Andrographis paniculata TaxID=175694 RepID=UPI0021E6F598|nr:BURP domain protein USPL1-like [Andrographis paniculata]